MAFGAKPFSSESPYEVRCPRCDVSFPPEARTCMHCGGPTGASGVFAALRTTQFDQTSIEATEETPFSIGDSFGTDPFADETDPNHRESRDRDMEEESSGSIGQSIFKSLGGIVWVILLIGFSLARSCGDG